MAVGGGMKARGGDKLRPKRDKFYHHSGVETVLLSGGICTAQLLANSATDGARPGTMTRLDRETLCGRPERLD